MSTWVHRAMPCARWENILQLAKLTDYEISALGAEHNLCDGHARYTSDISPSIIGEAIRELLSKPLPQQDVEASFLQDFATLTKQEIAVMPEDVLLCPSASIAIELVANYLRLHHMSVALIEPVFDNLADILSRHNLSLLPLREEKGREIGIADYLARLSVDAFFLVVPNNPTGYCFSPTEFEAIINFCARNRKLLVLDFSFRHFAPGLVEWNQYTLLKAAGVEYIAIEDTGKVWPTAELKVSILSASNLVFSDLRAIYRDIFINHSPISIRVVGLFVRNSIEKGLEGTVLRIVEKNRQHLRTALASTSLRPVTYSNVSVEWIELPKYLTDTTFERNLAAHNVRILPGSKFYWTGADIGHRYIRVAMMRDPAKFASAVLEMQIALDTLLEREKDIERRHS